MNVNIYAVRRGILKALKDAALGGEAINPAPLTVDALIELKLNTQIMYTPPQMVKEEWRNLKAHGYIQAIPGFNGESCEITRMGLEQLSIEFPQHPFVHGPGAIK